jgi:predicted DCC family thiol-disulfide oxidoreductase YuxK
MTFSGPLLLFDGVCNLCNSSVRFVIRYDRKKIIKFTPLQSDQGRSIGHKLGLETNQLQSIIYQKDGRYFQKSRAVIEVLSDMGGVWPFARMFLIIPTKLADWMYEQVARKRYKWFGKKNVCMVPSPDIQKRFLTD